MSNLVIVAIPAEDDIVWKISSEKMPHLTLMYLGEVSEANNAGRMAEFVQHALNISEHGPFYLDVDHRGELGPDKADVLFFSNGWDSKWIKSLRGQLLKQNDIRTAFEQADQFPEWVPHLTLGYPEAPAKELDDPNAFNPRFYSVHFDRIAVWVGDYEGPEFRLKWPERDYDDSECLAYGESVVGNILNHHGVKGMRWGQRKDNPGSVIAKPKNNLTGRQVATVAGSAGAGAFLTAPLPILGAFAGIGVARLASKDIREGMDKNRDDRKAYNKDKKWEKEFKNDRKFADVHNDMADHMNAWLPDHNKKYDGVDLNKDAAKMKEYEDGYFKEQGDSFARSYSKIYGSSPSGKYKVSVIPGTNRVVLHDVRADPSSFAHAAEPDEPLMTFAVTHDKFGRIIKVEPVPDLPPMVHSMLDGEAFVLEHFGIKGMRWGQRKAPPEAVTPSATSTVPHGSRRKTKIETEGGENHPAHEDAIKVARAQAVLKKSGTAALSNQELRDVANRLQLENQVSLLTASSGKKFVRKHITGQTDALAREGLREGVRNAPTVARKVRRGAAVAGATAALM